MPVSNSRCEATTKTHGTQCVNGGAEWCAFHQKMLCHLHHPDSTFRKQVAAKRGPRHRNIAGIHVAGRAALDRDAGGAPTRDELAKVIYDVESGYPWPDDTATGKARAAKMADAILARWPAASRVPTTEKHT